VSDDTQKSYSIWGILAVFLLLAGLGLAIIITSGSNERSPTQRLADDPSTSTTTSSSTTSSTTPMTFPDGTPPPERIEKVTASPGQIIYTYRLPAGFMDQPTKSMVAPAIVESADGGKAVSIAMACAVSDGSVPAEVIVLEDPMEIRVVPVAIGHALGSPCPSGQTIERITIPLEQPQGTRRLVVTPSGAAVKLPGA
jgi:hypothetical protein